MNRTFTDIPASILLCAEDLMTPGTLPLEAQARAYDLLDAMLSDPDSLYRKSAGYSDSAAAFRKAVEDSKATYDEAALQEELGVKLKSLDDALTEARFKAASASSLHEFAKEVFEIWQNSGIFARRRALKELRARAGFRLESHRIGNYVAKTFDLQNEAQTRFSRAQQAVFAADVAYKIKTGTFAAIYDILKSR